ncbi:type II secretion system F family protein [Evansella tamaricis]|uniref:Type II secretion system F family protein n=1 Tax=Evansella tamaricis TaxID=2069301 RepID=A0ABS6JK45_9BACI|nr:type II secretion system F family protein [Evansella tamaricis]MBU9714013.1 type II secretion system F family protein [Evansella tamaricis]
MIIFLYTFTILLIVFGFILMWREKKVEVQTRIATVFQGKTENIEEGYEEDLKLSFSNRILIPIWKKFKRKFSKNVNSKKQEKLERKLLQAGNPLGMTAVEFQIVQVCLFVFIPTIFGGYSLLMNMGVGRTILVAGIGILLALMIPSYYLKQKTNGRNKQAQKELPDFLDLVTVSIEAGLGFDSALSKVVAKGDGVLANEFQRCLEEMRLGKTRREALSGVRDRLQAEDVKVLIGSIIQAEQLGIGMVQILRVQSSEIREKRKQRAEEAAMKAPIKMLFPLVVFIFPCIFIVILGPAIIGILETF